LSGKGAGENFLGRSGQFVNACEIMELRRMGG
jgi:hypothetical protein